MSAPVTYPDWDTNATNTSALVSGHVTDGFAADEIPTSRELNEWMMLVGLWIRWIRTAQAEWYWMNAGLGYNSGATIVPLSVNVTFGGAITCNTAWYIQANGANTGGIVQLPVGEGDVIDQFGIQSIGDGTHDLGVALMRQDSTLGVNINMDFFTITAQAASYATTTANTGSPRTVGAGESWYIIYAWNGGTAGQVFHAGARITKAMP